MTVCMLLALALTLGGARGTAAGSEPGAAGADFFTNGALHHFEIQVSPTHLQALRAAPREYVPVTVLANGRAYTNVGMHLKGVATFRPVDDQPSLTLNFGKYRHDQRFHGLRKIHLNNGKEDPTFLCEALSAERFAKAGLPAARVAHARTRLNGRDLGPYVVIEGFTPEFLERYFRDTDGNLYDGGFRKEITDPLERLLGQRPENWADLKQLAAAAETPDLEQRWQELALRLDTNHFARYLAMQVLISNWDGYALFRNNYRIYHDPASRKIYFLAHGMDQTFSRPLAPLMPPRWEGLVARAFMATRPGRELYQRQIPPLFTNVCPTATITRQVDELAALLHPLLLEQGTPAALAYDRQVAALRRRIEQRGAFITQQLGDTNWMNSPRSNPPQRRLQ